MSHTSTDETLIAAALERVASKRAAYLHDACAGDAAQRARIETLLRAHEDSQQVMATSAFEPGAATRPSSRPAEKSGDRIGRYKLVQKIGEGGCGIVYMAEQQEPVVDDGATDTGRPFFVMELVRSVTITKYCDEQNLSTAARLDLFTTFCHAAPLPPR